MKQKEVIQDKIKNTIAMGNLEPYYSILENIKDEHSFLDIAAAALKLALSPDADDCFDEPEFDFGETGARPGMVKFFMNIGREDEIGPAELARIISEESGIPEKSVGAIRIFDRFSFVEVPQEMGERVLFNLHHNVIKGRKIVMAPAKPRQK